MTVHTFSSRDFTRDVSAAKRATASGPVFITDRGKPAYALLKIDDYHRMITPPVGGLLFVTSNVSKVPLSDLVRELKPFLIAHGVVLVILTFVPSLSTWLPRALGFK